MLAITTGWEISGVLAAITLTIATILIPSVSWYARHERTKELEYKKTEEQKANKQNDLYVALLGKKPTFSDPTPAPGVLERLSNLEVNHSIIMANFDEQNKLLIALKNEVTPNGGNTSRLGDRIVKIEKHLRIED